MQFDKKQQVIILLEEIRKKVGYYANHSLEDFRRVPVVTLVWLALDNSFLELQIKQLKDKLKENKIFFDFEVKAQNNIIPDDEDYLEAGLKILDDLEDMEISTRTPKN